jgi:hypothetical protein
MNHFNHFTLLRLTLLFFLTLSFNHQLYAARALPEFDAIYGIKKFGIKVAEANYRLSHTETGYKFTQNSKLYGVASAFGSDTISAVSLVDEVRGNLLLTKHKYTQTGREKNRDEDFSILWQTYKNTLDGKITGVVRSKEIDLKTDSEIWEALSFQIPLMIEANENTKEYPYKAILKGKIDTYKFVLTSIKKVNYAGKEYKALQLVRTDPKKDRQLHIWLLPKLNNIPFLIENYRKGKEHSRVQLESVQFSNEKPLIAETMDESDDF